MRTTPLLDLRSSGIALCASLAGLLPAAAGQAPPSFHEPNAILLKIAENDLNHVVLGLFHASGGPVFEGAGRASSKGIRDLEYRASLSEPTLSLGEEGRARLGFDIRDARLRIGALERKVGWRTARCENAGLRIDPSDPLDVSLSFRLAVENGDLRIVPEKVSVSDARENLHLVKPSRCTNAVLPTWLLWWLGKPHLRQQFDRLDDVLLEKARKSAARLNDKGGLLRWQWEDLLLYPEVLETRGGTLLVGLTGSSTERRPATRSVPAWAASYPARSFIALSDSLLDAVLASVASREPGPPRRPRGNAAKIFASTSVHALIPGLRDLGSQDEIHLTLAVNSPPDIELRTLESPDAPPGQALIGLLLSGIELGIWRADGPAPVGTLRVESARLGLVPFLSVLGGISFRIVENEWRLSSEGIDFDEELIAAALQEIVFGEVFETTYEPLATDALTVGDAGFAPARFRVSEGYLVIELAPL